MFNKQNAPLGTQNMLWFMTEGMKASKRGKYKNTKFLKVYEESRAALSPRNQSSLPGVYTKNMQARRKTAVLRGRRKQQ